MRMRLWIKESRVWLILEQVPPWIKTEMTLRLRVEEAMVELRREWGGSGGQKVNF